MGKYGNGSIEKLCPTCGKTFLRWPCQNARVHCSRACYIKHLAELSPEQKAVRQQNLKRTREQILEQGKMGGHARAARLTPEQRSEISRKACLALHEKWSKQSIVENMRRAQAMSAAARTNPICPICGVKPKEPITGRNKAGKKYWGYCRECNCLKRRSISYGLSLDQTRELLQRGLRCMIRDKEDTKIVIDHDHATGIVRGLLCSGHNFMVAYLERTSDEIIQRAREYVNGKHLNIVPCNEPCARKAKKVA